MKKLSFAAMALLLCLTLTGCGSAPAAKTPAATAAPTEAPAANGVKITYHMNYDGAEDKVETIEAAERLNRPEAPSREGYIFSNWYTDADCTKTYTFGTRVEENVDLFAGWQPVYVFETEYINLDDFIGAGYSGGAAGPDAIVKDDDSVANASNGFYLSFAYVNGVTLEYVIESDRAVDDASIYLRLSAEVTDITINGEKYSVIVNGTKLPYGDIVLDNVPAMSSSDVKDFEDYLIATGVSLVEGKNIIHLVTSNTEPMGGTMTATAPMIDCLKVVTSANLTWNPMTENIEGR